MLSSPFICSYLWSGSGPRHNLLIYPRYPLAVVLCVMTFFKKTVTIMNHFFTIKSLNMAVSQDMCMFNFPHHKQCQFVLGHGLQVRDDKRLRKGVSAHKGLSRFDGGGEAVEPRPLTAGPGSRGGGGGGARLRWAEGQMRWDRRMTQ